MRRSHRESSGGPLAKGTPLRGVKSMAIARARTRQLLRIKVVGNPWLLRRVWSPPLAEAVSFVSGSP